MKQVLETVTAMAALRGFTVTTRAQTIVFSQATGASPSIACRPNMHLTIQTPASPAKQRAKLAPQST